MSRTESSPLALAAGPSEQVPTCKSDLHVAECPNCEHSFDEHGNAIGCLLGDCDCAYTKRKLFDLARGALPELLADMRRLDFLDAHDLGVEAGTMDDEWGEPTRHLWIVDGQDASGLMPTIRDAIDRAIDAAASVAAVSSSGSVEHG